MRNDFVYPIALTYPDWGNLCKLGNEFYGKSPMAGLDKTTIKVTDPSAYLRCLDFRNQPTQPIVDNRLKHCLITMGLITDKFCLIMQSTELNILVTEPKEDSSICIMSGTIDMWRNSCISASQKDSEILRVISQCIIILEGSGFKDLFNQYNKKYINNEKDQFLLVPKR